LVFIHLFTTTQPPAYISRRLYTSSELYGLGKSSEVRVELHSNACANCPAPSSPTELPDQWWWMMGG